jgi:hypothetical protein
LTNTQTRGLCHDKKSEPESLADQQGINEEIDHPIAATDGSQNKWQIPTSIKLDSSGLWQNAHLRSASPQSFTSAHVPFSTICSNLSSGLTSMVHSLAVKVQASSTPKNSCYTFALLAFEPVTSTNQYVQQR